MMLSTRLKPLVCSYLSHNLCTKVNISETVKLALNQNRPVIALESTVITHGLPFPHNLDTARSLEKIISLDDCTPATIAIFDGKINVGLSDEQLVRLAQCKTAKKVSRRDIAASLSQRIVGGTTVSATMLAAHWANISIFATGGIGGVHRGAEQTFDISADLVELGRTPVAVVCAGVKSILDIPKTLEFLETQGVPVAVFGQTDQFPGFFTSNTGLKAPFNSNNIEEIAALLEQWKNLEMSNGLLITCPIPSEEEAAGEQIEAAIQKALTEAKNNCVSGQQITPFILQRVNELTEGGSLRSNIALLKNNAKQAARIAKTWQKKIREKKEDGSKHVVNISTKKKPQIVVIGATIVDYYAQIEEKIHLDGRTHSAEVFQACGGVGRNHADALNQLGMDVLFLSAIGDDANGNFFRNSCSHMNLDDIKVVPQMATASYISATEHGTVKFSAGAIDEITAQVNPDYIRSFETQISQCQFTLLDGNLSSEALRCACEICNSYKVPVWFEPADMTKVERIFDANAWTFVSIVSPNRHECTRLFQKLQIALPQDFAQMPTDNLLECVPPTSMGNLDYLILTLGADGMVIINKSEDGLSFNRFEKPHNFTNVVSDSGAGDCFNSGFLYGLVKKWDLKQCVKFGLCCAGESLKSRTAVPKTLAQLLIDFQ